MTNDATRAPRTAAVLFLLIGSFTCKTREPEFCAKLFSCDVTKPDQCGPDCQGRPMTCYPGHLLGGQDFCAPTCDPTVTPADSAFTCINSGAPAPAGTLVRKCRPTAGRDDPAQGCPDGLACYRTDLLVDEGICLMMTTCKENDDCGNTGPTGKVCGGSLIRDLVSGSTGLSTDGLQCLQRACRTQGTLCSSPDEACLFNNFASGGMLPDICVPQCDQADRCPPNFACAHDKDVAPGSLPVCVPGMPGTRCRADQDCMVGTCVDTGAGFKMCTVDADCKIEQDTCSILNGPVDVFFCAEGVPGRPRCVTTRAFSATCMDSTECTIELPIGFPQECIYYSPDTDFPDQGACRVPCGPDRRCPTRGGVPFFCLGANGEGGCYASQFGLPCLDDTECLRGFSCQKVSSDPRSRTNYSQNICTIPCDSDADCDKNPLTFKGGFCDIEIRLCRLAASQAGVACTQDTHCRSRKCPSGVCLP